MKLISKSIIRAAALTAAILIFTAGGNPVFASDYSGSHSPSYFAEEGSQDEGNQGEGGQGEGGQDEGGQGGQQGGQEDVSAQAKEYTNRLKAALDELESHARAMGAAGNAGDRKKYDSELKEYEKADRAVDKVINDMYDFSTKHPSVDFSSVVDQAYERLEAISRLCDQAEAALANSVGGAMDEDGKTYSLSKVNAKVSLVGKSGDIYDEAVRAVGNYSTGNDNIIVYKISLFVGKKSVHLIGGLTKSVTIGIPNDRIGRSPVTSYYLWDEGDGNHGAAVAEKRGSFDTSTWCLTVKVSKAVTYYVVCGRPGTRASVNGDDSVAVMENGQKLTVDELRVMLEAHRLADDSDIRAKALEAVNPEGKASEVYEIVTPDGVTLNEGAEVVAELTCPYAADKAVEIYRMEQDLPEWVGTFLADEDGKLQFTTSGLGVFVLCWQEEMQEETPAAVAATQPEPQQESSPLLLWIVGAVAAIAIIVGTEFVIHRYFKK